MSLSRQEIEATINAEKAKFNLQKFPGVLPKWFLDNFSKIIMETSQTDVPYRGEIVNGILHKKVDDLNIFEVGFIVNVLLTVPPKYLATNIEKFLVKKVVLEQIVAEYNSITQKESERLERKTKSFADAHNKNNASRIIHN